MPSDQAIAAGLKPNDDRGQTNGRMQTRSSGGPAAAASAAADAEEAGGRAGDSRRARATTAQEQVPIANVRFSTDAETTSATRQADGLRHAIETWAAPAASGAAMDRAGIIASCILNAAMIPGWPAPRPFELAAGRALVPERQPAGAPIDENEALNYLASMGASRGLLDRIRELTRSLARRLKLLLGLAVLATLMTSALRTLQVELAALAEELEAAEEEELVGGRRHIAG
jgi:hypothetical protein